MLKLEDFKKVELKNNNDLSYICGGVKYSHITGSSDPSRIGRYDKENSNGGYDLSTNQEDSIAAAGWD